MTTPLDQTERAAFSAWLDKSMFDGSCEQAAWEAWQSAIASRWQPIAEAPRNRKLLVGYHNQHGKWRTAMGCYYPPQTLLLHEDHDWDDSSDGYAEEGWYEETQEHEVVMPLEIQPTHFQYLPDEPAPPIAAKAAKETPQ